MDSLSHSSMAERAESILAGLPHPVMMLDHQGYFAYVNPAAEEFFQLGFNRLKGETLAEFIDPQHDLFDMIQRVRLSRVSLSDQGVLLESPQLGARLVDIQLSPLLDENAVIISLQERALAERLRGQEQFRGAARSMGSLSAMLAHEIKNPLAGIRGAAELLGQLNADDDLTDLIIGEADRIAALLTRMEELAGGKAIERRPLNIHQVIDHAVDVARRSFAASRQILSHYDPSLPSASGDRDLLIQVFLNLIKNACEATDNNGIISITTSFNLGARFASGAALVSAPLEVMVEDNGSGIEPELRPRIFDPFVSSKASGSGLGLAFVAGAIADHGGGVEVLSGAGGSSFKISLPVARNEGGGDG